MIKTSDFGSRIAAAATAFALTLALIGGTVTMPAPVHAQAIYVGVVA